MTTSSMSDRLRTILRSGTPSPGLFLGLDCAQVTEIAGVAGVEWVVLDLEHSGVTAADVGPTIIAANAVGIPVIVRVNNPDRSQIGWVVDQGAAGVMVPRVQSVADAETITRHFHYPPRGDRGVASYTRAASWGKTPLAETPAPVCIVQIETPGALAEVDRICQIDGVDALFVGPLDLSASLGVMQDFTHPVFQDALTKIFVAAARHHTPVGTIAGDDRRATELVQQGATFVALGSDAQVLRVALGDKVTKFSDAVPLHTSTTKE